MSSLSKPVFSTTLVKFSLYDRVIAPIKSSQHTMVRFKIEQSLHLTLFLGIKINMLEHEFFWSFIMSYSKLFNQKCPTKFIPDELQPWNTSWNIKKRVCFIACILHDTLAHKNMVICVHISMNRNNELLLVKVLS